MRIGQKATIVECAGLGKPVILHGIVCHIEKNGKVWIENASGIRKCSYTPITGYKEVLP